MTAINSRAKGSRGELEIVHAYMASGFPEAHRTPNSGGLRWKGDVQGVEGLTIEVKRNEKLNIWTALDQVTTDCALGQVPALHFRRSRSNWWVAVPLEHWIPLWQQHLSAR